MYSEKDRKKLLKLARDSLQGKEKEIEFKEKKGVFVTLTKNGQLRGCIGVVEPVMSLSEAIALSSKSVSRDPRFPALQKEELKDINIEISILSSIQQMKNKEEIEIGKDGLIIEFEGRSGLLLPQVATEYGMNKKEFLEAVSQKAGLSKDSWKDKKAKLSKFQVEKFSE